MPHRFFPGAALLAVLFALISQSTWAADEAIPPSLDTYKGRTIARTMHYDGAPWLIRESREREEECSTLLKLLKLKPGQLVADIGCGNGFYALQMAKQIGPAGKVLCVDIQSQMLRLLKARATEAEVENVELIHSTLIDPKLPDGKLDLVLLVDVYHEFSHPEHMLRQIRRSLKPGGRVALVEFRLEDPQVPIKLLHKMSQAQIMKEFPANGFKLVETRNELPWQHVMFFARDDSPLPEVELPKRPNFVFILVDDLGWADIGCNGSTFYETPNIDRLAQGGMRLTNAYAACHVCSPTRASIMTGRYPARLHLTNFLVGQRQGKNSPVLTAPYNHQLALDEVTLAEALSPGGYTSGHVGKWHLGTERFYPQRQGFAVNIAGTRAGMPRGFFFPKWKENVPLEGLDGDYLPDRLTDGAIRFMEANRNRPFFLYMAYYAVHIPIQGKPDLVAKYQAKKPGETQNNPHYAAMVESVDQNVGRLMTKLDELGLSDDTVVVFFSDNGGLATPEGRHTPATNNAPLRGGKGQAYEGGVREPLIVRWPERIKPGSTSDVPVASIDFFPTMLEMAKVAPPKKRVIDGVSLVPLLTGKGQLPQRELYWHYPHFSNQGGRPSGSVRDGDFKLIEFYEHGRLELYNLKDDLGETQNLAAKMPEKTKALQAKLAAWRKRVDATMPPANPNYVKGKEGAGR